jgi:hypothetical protein
MINSYTHENLTNDAGDQAGRRNPISPGDQLFEARVPRRILIPSPTGPDEKLDRALPLIARVPFPSATQASVSTLTAQRL